jgi:UDP-glucose 4-epimerase
MDSVQQSNILIVGGGGFFGARLAEAFAETGSVVVTSRSLSPERERWLARNGNRIVWQKFDSAQDVRLTSNDEKPYDCVFNLATPSAGEATHDPSGARARALATVRACLDLVSAGRAVRFIQVSTFHVYGAKMRSEYADGATPQPTHPYGEIHALCECEALAAELSVGAVRLTNVVGAPAHCDLGPQWNLIFLDLCRQAVEKDEVKLLTDGLGYRDFVTVPDAVAAFRLLVAGCEARREPINLSLGKTMRLDDLARRICAVAGETLGTKVQLTLGERRDGFDRPFVVRSDRLRADGWVPENRLDDEIRRTVRMLKDSAA